MRVVAGSLRGRRVHAPPGTATRPTTDKVREAIFNALVSRGLVEGARVADLFGGSGALGIEALSRGAEHVTFVERDRGAVAVLEANLEDLGVRERSSVVVGDATVAAHRLRDVDLVFADPPYDFAQWAELLTSTLGAGAQTFVAESDREVTAPPGWQVTRSKRYGRTWVTILDRLP